MSHVQTEVKQQKNKKVVQSLPGHFILELNLTPKTSNIQLGQVKFTIRQFRPLSPDSLWKRRLDERHFFMRSANAVIKGFTQLKLTLFPTQCAYSRYTCTKLDKTEKQMTHFGVFSKIIQGGRFSCYIYGNHHIQLQTS